LYLEDTGLFLVEKQCLIAAAVATKTVSAVVPGE
jgi:hypothetical protein